ncbi:MAG: hypothetical protein RL376_77 [Verrucomicrobiota bacterium]|jgi:hypothetical protein
MHLRPLVLSLALLLPAAAGVWWFQRPQPAPSTLDARIGQRVADPAVLAEATRIQLKSGERTLEFTRSTDARWTLGGTPALPADLSRLGRLTADLVSPKIERLVTSSPARLASLALDTDRLSFLDASGKPLLSLDLGKTADGGGRFLRFGDETKAYLARLNLNLDPTPDNWRDTALLPGLKATDITSLTLQFPNTAERVTISRPAADKPWTSPATPAGQQIKASLLDSQTNNLASLRYTNYAPNLDPGVIAARILPREVSFITFSGRKVKISFARAAEIPAPPAPAPKEGEAPPPPPPAAPRPVYVEITDSQPDALLVTAARTHAFEVADWIFTALPASPAEVFEPVPAPPAATTETPAPTAPVSVTTPPLSAPAPAP